MNQLLEVFNSELDKSGKLLLDYPWHDKYAYGMWLAQTYHMVCHSTRLVALAGAHCDLDDSTLHARFIDHSKEERGHEKVATTDLKNLGYDITDFPLLASSASMYQIQYYWIQFIHPTSFFGYTLALEGLANKFGNELYKKIKTYHGDKASRFIMLHSQDDIVHMESAMREIQNLDWNEIKFIIENLKISNKLYRLMLEESIKYYSDITTKSA